MSWFTCGFLQTHSGNFRIVFTRQGISLSSSPAFQPGLDSILGLVGSRPHDRALFIRPAMVRISSSPSRVRCFLSSIMRTTLLKLSNSCRFLDFNLCFSKKGRILVIRLACPLALYAHRSPWFRTTDPQPNFALKACSSCTSRTCWTTTNSGRTWNPTFIPDCRLMPTKKHPSPSTNPTIHCGSRFMAPLI